MLFDSGSIPKVLGGGGKVLVNRSKFCCNTVQPRPYTKSLFGSPYIFGPDLYEELELKTLKFLHFLNKPPNQSPT